MGRPFSRVTRYITQAEFLSTRLRCLKERSPRCQANHWENSTSESALTSCAVTLNGPVYAGYSDWRLPNVRELSSIVDYGAPAAPYIDSSAFPGTVATYYWASSTDASAGFRKWSARFNDGGISVVDGAATSAYVRCVRGGP